MHDYVNNTHNIQTFHKDNDPKAKMYPQGFVDNTEAPGLDWEHGEEHGGFRSGEIWINIAAKDLKKW